VEHLNFGIALNVTHCLKHWTRWRKPAHFGIHTAQRVMKMERFEFIRFAARQGIPFLEMSDTELAEELIRVEQLL